MVSNTTQKDRLFEFLKQNTLARFKELQAIGVTATTISRAVNEGSVLRIGRGLYQLPGSDINSNSSLAEVSKQAPNANICLLSALAFHGLTDQMPRQVWIAIGASHWEPGIAQPKIRVVRFREPYFSAGVERHKISGTSVPIYSVTKSLCDAFRNPKLVDRSVAIECLKSALAERKASPAEVAKAAKEFGAWNKMRPYLEAIISNG